MIAIIILQILFHYKKVNSDGWCEQGAYTTNKTNSQVVTFKKPFKVIPSVVITNVTTRANASYDGEIFIRAISTTSFTSGSRLNDVTGWSWIACGKIN